MEKDYLDTLPVIKKLKPIEANFEAILKPVIKKLKPILKPF